MNVEELKKNVEVFGKSIERLEQLKAEFVEINITGHEKEAEEIKNMLKDVSAIPELEIRIKLADIHFRRTFGTVILPRLGQFHLPVVCRVKRRRL